MNTGWGPWPISLWTDTFCAKNIMDDEEKCPLSWLYGWGDWGVNCKCHIEQLSYAALKSQGRLWTRSEYFYWARKSIINLQRELHTTNLNCQIVDRFERNDWVPRRRSDKLEIIDTSNRSLQHLTVIICFVRSDLYFCGQLRNATCFVGHCLHGMYESRAWPSFLLYNHCHFLFVM